MRNLRRTIGLLCIPATLALAADLSKEELELQRQEYFHLKAKHSEQFAWLRNEGLAFLALPPERQQQIIELDHALHQESSASQARLHNALERYVGWLEKLPEEQVKRIREAKTKLERLAIIKEYRDEDWVRTQPKVFQEQAKKWSAKERAEKIASAKHAERQRKGDWEVAARFWHDLETKQVLPARLADFADVKIELQKKIPDDPKKLTNLLREEDIRNVPMFVEQYLMPVLSDVEKTRLKDAEGKWPLFPQTLLELAEKHPPALPGATGFKTFLELPTDLKVQLAKETKGGGKFVPSKSLFSGRWPEFAMSLTKELADKRASDLPFELWAFREEGLSRPMREFMLRRLIPVLDANETKRLIESHNRWPAYPQTIEQLAQAHNLQPPWFVLPGPRWWWDRYRFLDVDDYPEVPSQKLREFLLFGMDDFEEERRNRLKQFTVDPEVRQEPIRLFFEKHPMELRKLRQADLKQDPRNKKQTK